MLMLGGRLMACVHLGHHLFTALRTLGAHLAVIHFLHLPHLAVLMLHRRRRGGGRGRIRLSGGNERRNYGRNHRLSPGTLLVVELSGVLGWWRRGFGGQAGKR